MANDYFEYVDLEVAELKAENASEEEAMEALQLLEVQYLDE